MNRYSVDDYAHGIVSLLPTGLAWNRNVKSIQYATLRAIGRSFARSDSDAHEVLTGGFPATTIMMLSEWENTLGLPNDCAIGESNNIGDRQRAVVSKLISTGGLNRNYYTGVAAALGYEITITQFRPAMCAMSVCGDAINGEEWPFTWQINTFGSIYRYSYSGSTYCGDALASWGDKAFECAINKISPSHINVIFSYWIGEDFNIPEYRSVFDIALNKEWPKILEN